MATIRDVAKASGVSVATVSYVLNNGPRPVHPDTRQRVLAAMRHLNYHPNAMARGLVRRRMNTLGVLFGTVEAAIVTNPYASAVLQGVLTAAADSGYNVTLFTERWRDASRSAAPFRDRRTDGVLVIAPLTDSDMVSGLAALGLPLVVVSSPSDQHPVPSVDVDNEKGARLATEHLIALGHTRIAHLMGDHNQPSAPARRGGFCAALDAAGMDVSPEYLVPGIYEAKAGYENARRVLTLPHRPTAIFAGNDVIALAAIGAARDLGISVPGQLSVVGFDDIPAASLVTPPLTTVCQPLSRIGEKATRLLVACVEGKPVAPRTHVEEPALVVRGSTAPPVS